MEVLNSVLVKFQQVIDKISFLKVIGNEVECEKSTLEKLDLYISTLKISREILNSFNDVISVHYLNNFHNQIINLEQNIPYREYKDSSFINIHYKSQIKNNLEQIGNTHLNQIIESINFNLNFFSKLRFLSNNMVAIGANGSGKSSLSEYLKNSLMENGVVISAQKILIVPTFGGISNYQNTITKLGNYQNRYNNFRGTYSTDGGGTSYSLLSEVGGEFHALLDNLLAERSSIRNKFCDLVQSDSNTILNVPESTLDKVLNIWNRLIQHRKLICDGVNISLEIKDTQQVYAAHLMSDGEKVALYLIAHILQAPKNAFIVIDEPEMYLHKTILNKLWDTLENERKDCIFMYLTHDIDFASTRCTATKLWIKSFNYPNQWEIESIPDNEKLPETLLFELLGSRKNILFCEGLSGSIDESIYNTIFPNLTIKPVGTCQSVINYTKSFNSLINITTRAFGIIDSDHTPQSRLKSLAKSNIFALKVSEAENLLFDEDFLNLIAKNFMIEDIEKSVSNIKNDIISLFNSNKEQQASNYVSTKIDYYFKDSNLSTGMNFSDIENNFNNFISDINIKKDYEERMDYLNNIIENKKYIEILSCFNNKGIQKIPERIFNVGKFKDKSIRFLKDNIEARLCIEKYFDPILLENGKY